MGLEEGTGMWHGYIGAVDLGMTAGQRATLIGQLRQLGVENDGDKPNRRNHWRVNLAGDAVIFEAAFDADTVSASKIKTRLVNLFGVAASSITYATVQTALGGGGVPAPVVTYKHNSVPKFRLVLFGGLDADWGTSHAEVTAYLAANRAEWEAENV
jgi:hypothetical protein